MTRLKPNIWLVGALVVGAVVLSGCGDDDSEAEIAPDGADQAQDVGDQTTAPEPDPEATAPPETTSTTETGADDEVTAQVDVSVECSRGARLSQLPFDAQRIGFVAGAPDETAWTVQIVTITNRSDETVQVSPGFTVRYLDADGSTLGEEALDEPFPPAYTTAPGQTARRQIVRFDRPGVAGPVRDPDLAGRLFTDLGSCEVVGEVMVSPVSVDTLIDPAWADQVELEDCGLTDEGDRFEGTLSVTNSGDEAVDVEFGFEILDADGSRLGIGGHESYPVGPSEQAEIVGWAASFTVVDLDRAEDCALLTLSAR